MRAMVQHRFGTASEVLQLEEIETPVPGEGQLLVRVKATSANPYDWHFIRGEPLFMRLGPGELRPVIDSTVPFEETGFAVDLVESGSPGGKVAISGVE